MCEMEQIKIARIMKNNLESEGNSIRHASACINGSIQVSVFPIICAVKSRVPYGNTSTCATLLY